MGITSQILPRIVHSGHLSVTRVSVYAGRRAYLLVNDAQSGQSTDMKLINTCLIVSLFCSPAIAFDLKGIEVGKTATPAQLKAAFGIECGGCDQLTKIAGVWVKVSVSTDKAGRVSSIRGHFNSGFYAELAQAAREKYGKPADSRSTPMRNGFGAHFTSEDIWWIDAEGARVWIVQFINANEGLLLLESANERAAATAKEQADLAKSKM